MTNTNQKAPATTQPEPEKRTSNVVRDVMEVKADLAGIYAVELARTTGVLAGFQAAYHVGMGHHGHYATCKDDMCQTGLTRIRINELHCYGEVQP